MKRNCSHYIEEKDKRLTRQAGAALCAAALFIAAAAMCLPSCTNEPIFATIENEIELRDPNLEGAVPSVVQYYDGSGYWLFACNGYVKRKEGGADPGSWETVSIPAGRCAKLVAIKNGSDDELYGLFQNNDSDWSFAGICKYDNNGGWDSVSLSGSGAPGAVHQIGPAGDDAFYAIEHAGDPSESGITSDFNVYKYDGSSWTELSGSLDSAPIGMGGDYIVTKYRAYEVSGNEFSEISDTDVNVSGYGDLVPGNEYDIMGMCVNPADTTQLYVLTDDYLWHYNGSTWTDRTGTGTSSYDGFGAPAYFGPSGWSPLVLIPLEEGYREVAIASDGTLSGSGAAPGNSSSSSVATSARSQYRSSIEDYAINFMYVVTDSSYLPANCSYAVYVSIGHYKYSGLWGYYQGVQQEWNRE